MLSLTVFVGFSATTGTRPTGSGALNGDRHSTPYWKTVA